MALILVTGVSGFIGSHIAHKLLDQGHDVRGTVRNLDKGQRVVDALYSAGADISRLELVEANLSADAGWADAVKDCDYIQHIASPLPRDEPDDREALVPEARAGTQRVLEHGFSAGAKRIVVTSSIAAMMGQPDKSGTLTLSEDSWSDPDWKRMTAYPVSKTRAEISAWAYAKAQGFEDRLTVINPGLVFGPDTYKNSGASLGLIKMFLIGRIPRTPKLAYPIIDVRDCAAIHVAAMTAEGAGGRRLLATGETLWFSEIADILKDAYPQARQIGGGTLPNFVTKFGALFDDSLKAMLGDLGVFHATDAGYVTSLTHVVPRPAREAILASAESLVAHGKIRF